MRLLNLVPKFPRGVFGALVLAPMLYAGFALASTPAHAAGVSDKLLCINPHEISCQVDETSCYFESGGVGTCCDVCHNFECDDGSTFSRCRIECGVQC
jgi:hypothetical protein